MSMAWLVFGTLLILAAWWMLARAMPPAFRGAHDLGPLRRRTLRIAGALALLVSFACYLAGIGFEQGPVFWTCALMLGAMGVALWSNAGAAGGEKRAGAHRRSRSSAQIPAGRRQVLHKSEDSANPAQAVTHFGLGVQGKDQGGFQPALRCKDEG